jgi:hypothetical protein
LVLVMGRQGAYQRFGGLSLAVAIALPVVSQPIHINRLAKVRQAFRLIWKNKRV